MPPKRRVMLVDDHTVLRAGLRALLDRQPDLTVVADAADVPQAYRVAHAEQPDLMILDLNLPGGGSLGLIEKLRALPNAPKVLVLSMHNDPPYARAALAAGACGYVVKTIGEQELLVAVRAVCRGRLFVDLDDETLTRSILLGRSDRAGAPVAKLSDREIEVLQLLGAGHSNQLVAERLELSPKTVATYRARIAEKLGLKTTADFVQYVATMGSSRNPPIIL
jgi:two-component system response regulator NreC